MKPTRRGFLTTTALAPLATQKPPGLDAFRIARRHRIIREAAFYFCGMMAFYVVWEMLAAFVFGRA